MLLVLAVAIIGNLTDQTVTEGNAVTFTCHAIGEPAAPNISWLFNDILVNESDKYDILTEQLLTNTVAVIVSNLTVNSVESTDAGTYTCYATNGRSSDEHSANLSVNGMAICYYTVHC